MNKYVVEYETGEYDSWCMNQYTVEAESKEAIRSHLQKAIEEYVKERKEEEAVRAKRTYMNYEDWFKLWQEFVNSRSLYCMNVNGMVFGNADDVCLSENPLDRFEIYALDEWFDVHRPSKY